MSAMGTQIKVINANPVVGNYPQEHIYLRIIQLLQLEQTSV